MKYYHLISSFTVAERERKLQLAPWLDGSGYLIEAVPVPKTNRGEVKTDPVEW
jgi:3-isopropylmalate dehydratase